jgi:hypothetical protein
LEVCPAAGVYSCERPKPSFGQFYGIFVHRYLEYAKTRGVRAATDYIRRKAPRVLKTVRRIDVSAIPDGEVEAALLIDAIEQTAQVGDYLDAEPDRHLYARADLIWRDNSGRWVVWDYKTGKGPAVETSEQVRTLATGVWLREGRPGQPVDGAIVVVTPLGDLVERRMSFEPEALETHAKRIRLLVMRVAETRAEFRDGALPSFVPGPHCAGCDIFDHCPARPKG